ADKHGVPVYLISGQITEDLSGHFTQTWSLADDSKNVNEVMENTGEHLAELIRKIFESILGRSRDESAGHFFMEFQQQEIRNPERFRCIAYSSKLKLSGSFPSLLCVSRVSS